MTDHVLRFYPQPGGASNLQGLYLEHDLRSFAERLNRPFVYSNFVVSLDGRIAIPGPTGSGQIVPKQIANPRDWRLFQELAIQADVIISSGRYLRDYADGHAQEILRVYDDPQFADLREWRVRRGLSPQPDIAVISGSLDFPVPDALTAHGRSVVIFTTSQADPDRVADLERHAGRVVIAGETSVTGEQLVQAMAAQGYQTIYSATGPKVMHLLLAAKRLDRLYLTLAGRLLGGEPFSSIVEGPLLVPPVGMTLSTVVYDPAGLDGLGQLFLSYDRQ
jgi:riboflavin biosynthesis pyrimidine reductase